MQPSINQFIQHHPYVLPICVVAANLIFFRFFGSWPKLVSSYGERSPFVGQKWHMQSITIDRARYNGIVTIGINSTGLYIAPFFLFRAGHPPILIPWSALELEEACLWAGTVYNLRTAARPQIQLQIMGDLLKRLEQAANGRLPLNYAAEMQHRQAVGTQGRLSAVPDVVDTPPNELKIQGKLIAKIFAITFVMGLVFGGVNHGIAHYQAWQNPDRYHIYLPGQYSSPDPNNGWPDPGFEFLGLSKPTYVLTEGLPDGLFMEKYYSILGSFTEVRYRGRKWIGTGGGSLFLSSPIYSVNCLLPTVGGFVGMMAFLGVFGGRQMPDAHSKAAKRLKQVQIMLVHTFIAGLVGLFVYALSWILSLGFQAAG
jgi:hypothetical protein